jgi:3-hydroxyisobutyrate dehydrogenase
VAERYAAAGSRRAAGFARPAAGNQRPVAGDLRTIGLLGTGIMGAAMGRNLLRAGFELTAWNRSPEKAEPLAEDGAAIADSAAAAVDGADAVITMLSDGDAVRDVMFGAEGAAEALGADAIWLETSTIGIEATEELARRAAEAGVDYVDCPVLGTRQPAEEGKLVVVAAGPEALRRRAAPVFEAIGARTVEFDEVGDATRMKLVVNNWLLDVTAALAETIAVAESLGIEGERFLETIGGGPMDSPYAQLKGKAMLSRGYEPSFPLRLARKDARLVHEATADAGLELAVGEAAARAFAKAEEAGHGDDDMAAAYEAVRPRERASQA